MIKMNIFLVFQWMNISWSQRKCSQKSNNAICQTQHYMIVIRLQIYSDGWFSNALFRQCGISTARETAGVRISHVDRILFRRILQLCYLIWSMRCSIKLQFVCEVNKIEQAKCEWARMIDHKWLKCGFKSNLIFCGQSSKQSIQFVICMSEWANEWIDETESRMCQDEARHGNRYRISTTFINGSHTIEIPL